ncbi:hypothetical protein HA151_06235 [Prochlorococcus marinus XMU1419]|uniref:hypothetical protein n=1 Tax=Prochlorococcus marinus TaxID=1219 RepID=UPI001ADC2E49|nr:hypothetical protein [Prochlorococcus marinus]MBO8234115.1 hypothetical protein [Prochlorococcus marinus XMU1419]MBW3077577.1 hypothetical protein [Prochlorococcus marinus str. XMU1419]
MFLLIKKKYFFIIFFLLPLLISCSAQIRKNPSKPFSSERLNNELININNLRINLYKADKKLTPKIIYNNDGSSFYRYTKKPGEGEISLEELKERVLLGPDFYKKDREDIINLLRKINELKINNKLDSIKSGALGLWIPSKDTIVIDYRVVEMGSPTFLNVLSHEAIHVAQSCFSGSRNKFPKRIGLPLEYSTNLNLNLSHNLYSNKSEEVMNLEREAFTYSKVEGVAIKLLNNLC